MIWHEPSDAFDSHSDTESRILAAANQPTENAGLKHAANTPTFFARLRTEILELYRGRFPLSDRNTCGRFIQPTWSLTAPFFFV